MTPLEAKMAELKGRLAGRMAEESAAFTGLLEERDRDGIVIRAHKLAGIAGMLGAPDIGEAARELEEAALTGGDYRPQAEALLAQLQDFSA